MIYRGKHLENFTGCIAKKKNKKIMYATTAVLSTVVGFVVDPLIRRRRPGFLLSEQKTVFVTRQNCGDRVATCVLGANFRSDDETYIVVHGFSR